MSRVDGERQIADLCRQAAAQLASLGLPHVFTIEQLHGAVEQRRVRPVHLIPRELPVLAPHGLWVAGEHADYVFYDCAVGQVRQHQIIGHEFGHLLFDGDTATVDVAGVAAKLLVDTAPALVASLAQRTSYEALAERRAEVFGTVALQRMELWSTSTPPPATDPAVLARITATLESDGPRC